MNSKLLILHGWAYDTEKWKPFLKLLEEKGIDFELLKIPGLTSLLNEAWTLDDYVTWLESVVSGQKSVVLMGHSNGGRICLAYTLKYPKKVSKLILIDSAGIYHNEISLWLKRIAFKNLARFKKIAYNAVLKNILYKLAREDDYNKAAPNMKKTMQNLIESDLSLKLKEINTPTLIVWGEHDTTTPLSDGKFMRKEIKNSDFKIIKGARHSPQFSNTKEVFDFVAKFLKQD